MISIYQRAADDLDLDALTEGRGSLVRNLAMISLPSAAVALGIVYAIWRSFLAAGVVAAALFAASLFSNIVFFRKVNRHRLLKADTTAVEVFEVAAQRVLDIEPLGDDAPALCFFVGERKALLLVGQWLLKHEAFPAASFRLYRWRDSKKCIRIEVTGSQIETEHSTVQLQPSYRLRQIELIDAAPETLQEDLDRAFAKKVL
jgi:hypothetical protein